MAPAAPEGPGPGDEVSGDIHQELRETNELSAIPAVRSLVAAETWGIRAVDVFPAGTFPQVAINDKKMYPIYAKCVELGISVWVNAGVPGPRLRMDCQKVEYIAVRGPKGMQATQIRPAA